MLDIVRKYSYHIIITYTDSSWMTLRLSSVTFPGALNSLSVYWTTLLLTINLERISYLGKPKLCIVINYSFFGNVSENYIRYSNVYGQIK